MSWTGHVGTLVVLVAMSADTLLVWNNEIAAMRERTRLVGGTLEIRSAGSQATRVVLRVSTSDAIREDES